METIVLNKKDVYQIVTDRIIAQLEKGVVPWQRGWINAGMPQNLVTRKNYRGINVLLLNSLGFAQNYFLAFRQVNQLGGRVRKGEKSCPVIFWKRTKVENTETEEEKTKIILRYYNVFNISQCEDIPEKLIPKLKTHPAIKSCDEIVGQMPLRPEITHKSSGCYYVPKTDIVNLPLMECFRDAESYYQTLYHELVHSTGHPKRLNRKGFMDIGKENARYYAFEELIAEIGSAFLKSAAGISEPYFENSVAYLDSWLKVLRNDKRFIVYASARAQKAVDFILGIQQEEKEEDEASQDNIEKVT